jgi:GxxExxY protein
MEIEVESRNIPNNPQQEIRVFYKGQKLNSFFKPDLICFEQIVVELKALNRLTTIEEAQLLNYLKATGLPVGLLINFGADKNLEWKRMVLTSEKPVRTPKVVSSQIRSTINVPKPIDE